MPLKFNVFTGNFDQTGSGGGGGGSAFFAGEVPTYADLPLDGTAALDSRWLVRSNSGTWPFSSYKQAGVYVRIATVGSSRDNDYRLTDTSFFDVMSDAAFLIYDDGDATRNLKFQLSGISTGTTRTLTVPNASGRIQVEGQPIGNTTPAAITATTLNATNGTLTASAPVLDLSQTWNNSGVTFTGLRFNATNTASAAASLIADFQVGGTSQVWIDRAGNLAMTGGIRQTNTSNPVLIGGTASFNSCGLSVYGTSVRTNRDAHIGWTPDTNHLTAPDLQLFRDAADTLAQRRGANGQTFRIYNTFTDASNHERGFLRWSSNVLQIGTEAAGTGAVRSFQIAIGATNTCSFTAAGSGVAITCRDLAAGASVSIGTGILTGAANVIQQVNGTNAQRFSVFNTSSGTSGVNFERANFRWASNEFIIDAEAGGTGTSLRGIKIGSATSSLLGFYGATPAAQQSGTGTNATGFTANGPTNTVHADSTFTGNVGTTAYSISDIVKHLKTIGLIAS